MERMETADVLREVRKLSTPDVEVGTWDEQIREQVHLSSKFTKLDIHRSNKKKKKMRERERERERDSHTINLCMKDSNRRK